MKGSIELCKADLCIKAKDDFAVVVLLIVSAVVIATVVAPFIARLK